MSDKLNIRGQVTTPDMTRRRKRLVEHTHLTGKYQSPTGETHGTQISAWVYTPTDLNHQVAIFLRLSNGAGTSLARLTRAEWLDLIFQLSEWTPDLEAALSEAQDHMNALVEGYQTALAELRKAKE